MKRPAYNLIFFSGGSTRDNKELCQKGAELLFQERKPFRVAFVPAESRDSHGDYAFVKRKLQFLGKVRMKFQAIDKKKLTAKEKKKLFDCDVIYLGGGNTFYFLYFLQKQKLLPALARFAKKGGVIFGYSAGGIILTPNIVTAYIPSLDADENEIGHTRLKSAGLVDFEFSPHYVSIRSVNKELKDYSRYLKHPIYACADGAGIIVENGKIHHFVGEVIRFQKGKRRRIST